MPTPTQVKNRFIMRCVAKGLIYGLSNKVLAEKFNRTVDWVRRVQRHAKFESILGQVEQEIFKSSDRQITALRAKSLRVLDSLLKSKSDQTRLAAFDRVKDLHNFREGLGPGGVGAAVDAPDDEDEGSDEDYLLSEGAIASAFKLLEETPKDQDYIDVKKIDMKGKG